jgi:hypothetical protein
MFFKTKICTLVLSLVLKVLRRKTILIQEPMSKITRQTFIKQTLGWGTFLLFNPNILKGNTSILDTISNENNIYNRVLLANNKAVENLIQVLSKEITILKRDLGFDFANLAAAFCAPESKYYQKTELVPFMEKIMRFLLKEQNEDGTLDIGNIESPPDTAFILEPLCSATAFLNKNPTKILSEVKNLAKQFILKAGDALTEGGIHTPNHRWVVSAALAQIHVLYPNPKYIKRIDEWFSESLFIDEDGHYLERSMIYSQVIDRSLITIARLLNRPYLLEPVRRNLNLVYFHLEPNGDLVTIDSRRQDQFMTKNILPFYLDYRYMALVDKSGDYAAITNFIENVAGFEDAVLSQALFHFIEVPLLKMGLPKMGVLLTNYEQFFKKTNLVRLRKDNQTATIYGGTDLPLIVGSGRSTSPNFFSFRKGDAILKYMRLSCDFFSTGYFRSNGIQKKDDKYILYQRREVPYYQPLPDDKKRKDGDYKHSQSIDGRFWNKMDFGNRPLSNVKILEIKVSITEKNGIFELDFDIDGTDKIDVTIEFCFKEGGQISPMRTHEEQPDTYFLENGMGSFTSGKDTITFGKGNFKHGKLKGIEGEIYTSHFGNLRTEGIHVFITGKTPFRHVITLG